MKKPAPIANLKDIGRSRKVQRTSADPHKNINDLEKEALQQEIDLFKSQVVGVTLLPASNRKTHNVDKPLPIARQREPKNTLELTENISDEMDVEYLLETDEKLSFRRSGVSADTLKKLLKGRWTIQRQIDLHGLDSDKARDAVSLFLRSSVELGIRCIKIIHGKGLNSVDQQPVLKEKVKRWLVQKNEVMAFCQTPNHGGGEGALLVLLKTKQT